MSELSRPVEERVEGLDAERVEEAFASFADRVRELETVAADLRAELHALRSERAPARGFREERFRDDDEEWPEEPGSVTGGLAPSPNWVAAVPPPLNRPSPTPRLVLEGVFLLAVAVLAGLAALSAVAIVLVMAAAWGLVALSEWTAATRRARWRLDEGAPTAPAPVEETTGPWNMPVVGATVVEAPAERGPESESETVIAKLPELPHTDGTEAGDAGDPPDPAVEAEQAGRRRWFRPRRAAAETAEDSSEA